MELSIKLLTEAYDTYIRFFGEQPKEYLLSKEDYEQYKRLIIPAESYERLKNDGKQLYFSGIPVNKK